VPGLDEEADMAEERDPHPLHSRKPEAAGPSMREKFPSTTGWGIGLRS
jgi:hypothetical protein